MIVLEKEAPEDVDERNDMLEDMNALHDHHVHKERAKRAARRPVPSSTLFSRARIAMCAQRCPQMDGR